MDPALRVDMPLEAGWIRIVPLCAAAARATALPVVFLQTVLPIQIVHNATGTHVDSAIRGDFLLLARHPPLVILLPVAPEAPWARATVAATPLQEPPPHLAQAATDNRAVFVARVITLAQELAVALHALVVTTSPARDSAGAHSAQLVVTMA